MVETGIRAKLRALAREPLVHFLLMGAAIYLLYGLAGSAPDEESELRITVTSGEIEWLSVSWEKRWNRPPTREERDGLIENYIRETVFYREALAMGLDRDDTIIRRRLAQKLEFLTQDLADSVPATEEVLQEFFVENASRYQLPALTTFTQVFIDPDRHEDETLAHSTAVGAELRALDPPTEGAAALGDRFMLQSYYPERSEAEVAKLFGSEFARSVAALEPGRWHGPVLSGYGVHWVFVDQRTSAVMPSFESVRERVEQDFGEERREKFNEDYYASLRARYEVVIEEDATVEAAEPGESFVLSGAPQ